MKILLIGDSITDMGRNREQDLCVSSYGSGYPFFIEGELATRAPGKYEVYNRGIGGNRVVDLYARIKCDCWNLSPDIVSILIGVNDVWHGLSGNGVEIDRYERIYRMLLEDTKKALPKAKFMILEPFVLKGSATTEKWEYFLQVKEYAATAKKIAAEQGCLFVPLQKILEEYAEKYGPEKFLYDGVHPAVAGAKLIADEWLKAFELLK